MATTLGSTHGHVGEGTERSSRLSYAIVTPVRDELANLEALVPLITSQTRAPSAWIIVNDGSSDETARFVNGVSREYSWIRLLSMDGGALARGAPIVRAFHAGVAALQPLPDVVIKLDADISMHSDHFERLLLDFEREPRLGIAGGIGYEKQVDGLWRQRHGTGAGVWGACRGYRRECLVEIMPLEEHMGWDTLDLVKANVKGWMTRVNYELPFRHHRVEGERDGSRFRTAQIQGEAAFFMGYRMSYLALRTIYRALRDPAAVGLVLGYSRAALRRHPRCSDPELRNFVRREQSMRQLPRRMREALRPRTELEQSSP